MPILSPSKCRLFHNATLFGFCITHILNTECAKIWKKKIRRQTVKASPFKWQYPLPSLRSSGSFLRLLPLLLVNLLYELYYYTNVQVGASYKYNYAIP